MPVSKSENAKKFLVFSFKLLCTALIWIGTAILTKIQLAPGAKDWLTTLQQLPLWALILLIIFFPIAWLLIEFIATCFIEVRERLLERTAPRFALWLTELPGAVHAVLGRWWDACLARLGHWRFEGRYRARISEECRRLHNQTGFLYASAGFSLEQTYIELSMASSQLGQIDSRLLASSIRGRESIYGFLHMQQPGSALALLGRPGAGKTTLLRHLALLYAENKQGRHRLRRRIPILIELRRVTDLFTEKEGGVWKSPSLIQVVQHYWKQHPALVGLINKAPRDWLKRNLASGHVLVMVDGLDEVHHHMSAAEPDLTTPRQRVSHWLETEMLREEQRNCLFLITSRPGGFAEAPLKHRVTAVEIQPLAFKQRERFIYTFQLGCQRLAHPTVETSRLELGAAKATERLQEELRSKPHLTDLTVNPLLLHMVCLLYHLRGRLPADRPDLYKETCEVLLTRDLRAPGITERMRPQHKLAALLPLADYFMRSESPEAKSTDELLPVIGRVFETLDFPLKEFLDYVAKDSGLLQETEFGRWDFAHKTFYEYLAAEHWEKHPPTMEELAGWVEQDWWRVALLFYSAKSEDSPVISACLASGTPRALSLAFACVSAGHRVNATKREQALNQLHKALSNPGDQESFNLAAQAFLYLRMRETVPASADGKWLRREHFVSRAEYQLFLNSAEENQRAYLLPPHWKSNHFFGDPTAPIVGVTAHQAANFAKWAARNSGQGEWELPTLPIEEVDLLDGCWMLRSDSKSTKNGAEPDRGEVIDKNKQILNALTEWKAVHGVQNSTDRKWEQLLEMALFPNKKARRVPARLIWKAIFSPTRFLDNISPTRFLDNIGIFRIWDPVSELEPNDRIGFQVLRWIVYAFEVARQREGILFSNISRDLCDPFLNLEFSILSAAFFEALGLDFDIPPMSEENTVFEDVEWLVRVLDASLQLPPIRHTLTEESDVERSRILLHHHQNRNANSNRLRLLQSANLVIWTRENSNRSRFALLNYGLCLAELCLPKLRDNERHQVEMLHCGLKLLESRMEGKLEPWEKILLIRQA